MSKAKITKELIEHFEQSKVTGLFVDQEGKWYGGATLCKLTKKGILVPNDAKIAEIIDDELTSKMAWSVNDEEVWVVTKEDIEAQKKTKEPVK